MEDSLIRFVVGGAVITASLVVAISALWKIWLYASKNKLHYWVDDGHPLAKRCVFCNCKITGLLAHQAFGEDGPQPPDWGGCPTKKSPLTRTRPT